MAGLIKVDICDSPSKASTSLEGQEFGGPSAPESSGGPDALRRHPSIFQP